MSALVVSAAVIIAPVMIALVVALEKGKVEAIAALSAMEERRVHMVAPAPSLAPVVWRRSSGRGCPSISHTRCYAIFSILKLLVFIITLVILMMLIFEKREGVGESDKESCRLQNPFLLFFFSYPEVLQRDLGSKSPMFIIYPSPINICLGEPISRENH